MLKKRGSTNASRDGRKATQLARKGCARKNKDFGLVCFSRCVLPLVWGIERSERSGVFFVVQLHEWFRSRVRVLR